VRNISVLLAVIAGLTGCGTQPYDMPNNREIPEGPGILTGEKGAFVLQAGDEIATDETAGGEGAGVRSDVIPAAEPMYRYKPLSEGDLDVDEAIRAGQGTPENAPSTIPEPEP
jgi:hypothetical protein